MLLMVGNGSAASEYDRQICGTCQGQIYLSGNHIMLHALLLQKYIRTISIKDVFHHRIIEVLFDKIVIIIIDEMMIVMKYIQK